MNPMAAKCVLLWKLILLIVVGVDWNYMNADVNLSDDRVFDRDGLHINE